MYYYNINIPLEWQEQICLRKLISNSDEGINFCRKRLDNPVKKGEITFF